MKNFYPKDYPVEFAKFVGESYPEMYNRAIRECELYDSYFW